MRTKHLLLIAAALLVGLTAATAVAQEEEEDSPTSQPTTPTTAPADQPGDTAPPADTTPPPADAVPPPDETTPTEPPPEDEEYEEEEEEVVVITATRTPQKVEEAPSIITVVTRDQIRTLGYLTLTEVLRNTVGFGVNDNHHWPDTGIRGINDRTTYGDKIMMLVDGHNMAWRQFNRNYHNPAWVSMEDVARIEIIRGPGSAIWGANALTGVVNIVTRDWSNLDGGEVTFGGDHRFETQFVSARVGKVLSPNASFYASLSYWADDPDSLLAPLREIKLSQDPNIAGTNMYVTGNDMNALNLTLKAKYRWFRATFTKTRYAVGAPFSTFSIVGGDDSRFYQDRHIVTLSFQKMLFTGFELNARFDFDDYRFGDGTVYEANPYANCPGDPGTGKALDGATTCRYLREMEAIDRRYEWKLSATYIPTPTIQALAGVELEYLDLVRWNYPQVWDVDGLESPDFTNTHMGVFLQGQYTPVSLLGLTAGVRMDYDQIYGTVATPRAGVVVRLPSGIYVKGLFGSAFKGPSHHDLFYFRKNAFYGNPEVAPEKSYTGEGQLGVRLGGWLDLRVTGFYVHINDLIGYTSKTRDQPLDGEGDFPNSQWPDGDSSKTYSQKTNLDRARTLGVEAESVLRPVRWLTIQLGATWRKPEAFNTKDDKWERLDYSSEWQVQGSISLRLHDRLRATFRGIGVGDKLVPARAVSVPGFPTWATDEDPTLKAPAYFVGSFILSAQDVVRKGIGLSFKLDNVTNLEYWDAGRELLYPQRKLQGMLWGSVAF